MTNEENDELWTSEIQTMNEENDELWIQVKTNAATTFALKYASQQEKQEKQRTVEEMVPKEYHQYMHVFSKTASERIPKQKPWDHKIDLKPGFEPKAMKAFQLPLDKVKLAEEFVNENPAKGYIRPSESPQSSPLFFVDKKDGKKRLCQDYRYLNEWTIKNAYPLPLIGDLIDGLQGMKYFTKLDIRWGYNNIRIRKGDEWKAA